MLTLAALAALGAAACGGGSSSPPGPTGAAFTTAPTAAGTVPTVAASPRALTSEQIVQAMLARGLPVGEYADFSATSDPEGLLGKPGQYTSRTTFADIDILPMTEPYATVQDGGAVEVFASEADAQARLAAVKAANPTERVYLEGTALLRLSDKLTPERAAQYEAGFLAAVRGE